MLDGIAAARVTERIVLRKGLVRGIHLLNIIVKYIYHTIYRVECWFVIEWVFDWKQIKIKLLLNSARHASSTQAGAISLTDVRVDLVYVAACYINAATNAKHQLQADLNPSYNTTNIILVKADNS